MVYSKLIKKGGATIELIHYMMAANEETEYQAFGKREILIPFVPSPTVIKYTINNTSSNMTSTVVIGARFRRCIRFLEMPNGTTIKTLSESGRLDYMGVLADRYHVGMEETITIPEIRLIHEKRYGKIQNQTTYLNTYGKFFNK